MSMSPASFAFLQQLLRERTANVIGEERRYVAEARLAAITARHGLCSIDVLCERLREQRAEALRHEVIEALLNNETSFFRDVAPFAALRERVLPELLKRRGREPLRIWSAACSSGQEAYSVAITVLEHFPWLATEGAVEILASDIASPVLERAARGEFSQLEINRGLPAPALVKYFRRRGAWWEAKPELRALIRFRTINLVEPLPLLPPQDVIFLRNVMIYFDYATRTALLERMLGMLQAQGFLFLGGTETVLNLSQHYERVDETPAGCYRVRPGAGRS